MVNMKTIFLQFFAYNNQIGISEAIRKAEETNFARRA